jgi:hypothetical protein
VGVGLIGRNAELGEGGDAPEGAAPFGIHARRGIMQERRRYGPVGKIGAGGTRVAEDISAGQKANSRFRTAEQPRDRWILHDPWHCLEVVNSTRLRM